jgi:hypothetical protein
VGGYLKVNRFHACLRSSRRDHPDSTLEIRHGIRSTFDQGTLSTYAYDKCLANMSIVAVRQTVMYVGILGEFFPSCKIKKNRADPLCTNPQTPWGAPEFSKGRPKPCHNPISFHL